MMRSNYNKYFCDVLCYVCSMYVCMADNTYVVMVSSKDDRMMIVRRESVHYNNSIIISTLSSVTGSLTCYIWRRRTQLLFPWLWPADIQQQPIERRGVLARANRELPSEEVTECSSWRVACDDDMENCHHQSVRGIESEHKQWKLNEAPEG